MLLLLLLLRLVLALVPMAPCLVLGVPHGLATTQSSDAHTGGLHVCHLANALRYLAPACPTCL